jgi:K+ transporter
MQRNFKLPVSIQTWAILASPPSVKRSFGFFPALLLGYMGQEALVLAHPETERFWPVRPK